MSEAPLKPNTHFKFREVGNKLLITNEVGDFDFFSQDLVSRFFNGDLKDEEENQLRDLSVLIDNNEQWKYFSLARRIQDKYSPRPRKINYLILIPTLRCNLSCSYCQVSRAPEKAKGFDWDHETLDRFDQFLANSEIDHLKVEFQGGEPSLRLDLVKSIIQIVKKNSVSSEFVICSNMVNMDSDLLDLLENEDFTISTSIDGSLSTMTKNRTFENDISKNIFNNFNYILKNYGPEKIAALPTITENQINKPDEVIGTYLDLGFQSIFLRPVNYMGFARKKHKDASQAIKEWNKFYSDAMEIIRQANANQYFEEFFESNSFAKHNL